MGHKTGANAAGESRPGSNGNKGLCINCQISRTGASPSSDAVLCQTKDTFFLLQKIQSVYSKP